MSRKEFPPKVKVKRLHFAEFKCEGIVTREDGTKTRCNATLVQGRVEFDHDNPDGLTGEPTFENCRALCKICHAEKTSKDKAFINEAKRREEKETGARRPRSALARKEREPKGRPSKSMAYKQIYIGVNDERVEPIENAPRQGQFVLLGKWLEVDDTEYGEEQKPIRYAWWVEVAFFETDKPRGKKGHWYILTGNELDDENSFTHWQELTIPQFPTPNGSPAIPHYPDDVELARLYQMRIESEKAMAKYEREFAFLKVPPQ